MGGKCLKNKAKPQDKSDSLIQERFDEKSHRNYTDNHKFYFEIIQEKLQKFYIDNRNSHINISLSLDKKDFSSMTSAKKFSSQTSDELIHWKDYLLSYLSKQSKKGIKWCEELKILVENESIMSENKFLSLFFWQEYEIKNKLLGKHAKATTIIEKSTLIKPNESFCSVNTSSLSENDPTHEYKEYRSRSKLYLSIFKEHINSPEHPIMNITRHFIKIYSNYIQENIRILDQSRSNPEFNNLRDSKIKEITKYMQKFIIKIQICLRLMYCKTINYQCFIEERDEFINLITSFIFKDNKIFDSIYRLYEIGIEKQINELGNKLVELKDIKPIDLGIHEKFSLNNSTRKFQNKLMKIYEEKNKNYDLNNFLSSKKDNHKKKDENTTEKTVNDFDCKRNINIVTELSFDKDKDLDIPYKEAIEYLSQVKIINSPYEKMHIIANLSNQITSCINNYWKNYEKIITKSLLNIDADELMSIFIFIIIKSQFPELLIHTKIIKEFTTCVTKNTMIGYYFVTLDASVMYILDLKDTNILKNTKEILKKSFLPDKKSFLVPENEIVINMKNIF